LRAFEIKFLNRLRISRGDGSIDVKGKIEKAEKRLKIKAFKTNVTVFGCSHWSFFFMSVESNPWHEKGRVVVSLLLMENLIDKVRFWG
jgi:hypothetical protein